MTSFKEDIYIQMNDHIRTENHKIYLKDIAEIFCSSTRIKKRLDKLCIFTFQNGQEKEKVVSLLYVYQLIKNKMDEPVEIHSTGAQVCLVEQRRENKENKLIKFLKIAGVSLVTFFGAAFSIMTYNQDAAVEEVFQILYELLRIPGERQWILEFSYSIGVGLGVMVFFHHFNQKSTITPTTMEIQMNQYEKNIVDATVNKVQRSGKALEVDSE